MKGGIYRTQMEVREVKGRWYWMKESVVIGVCGWLIA